MKVARVEVLVLLGVTHGVGGALLRQSRRQPTIDDQLMSKDMSALEQMMQSTTASPSDGGSVNDLLASARWPSRESWDQTLNSVISGAKADPCSAPLLARARLSPYGFGAHLNQFANEVALAMYSGKPIALCAPSNVRDEWSQFFQDPGFARCDSCDWNAGPRIYHEMGMDVDSHDEAYAADLKRYLYKKLFTMNNDQQQPVDEGVQNLQSLGLSGSYVGVHVRRGDKVQEVPPVPIEKYASTIRDLCSRVGASTVFLASDDETVNGQLAAELGSSYKIVEQPRLNAEVYKLRGDVARQMNPGSEVEDEERSVLVDVSGLVHSAAFVGTASSNIDRLVFFERDPNSPAISLDRDGFLSMTR
jgi:hypothetical protein